MFFNSGELKKMLLKAYKDAAFSEDTGLEYTVQVNPEKYSFNYAIQHNDEQPQGTSSQQFGYRNTEPQELTFEFLFDSTGVLGGSDLLGNLTGGLLAKEKKTLMEDFALFRQVVYDYNADTHEPHYIKMVWGELLFNCRLTSMSVNFKLFKPDGTPIRATATCTFREIVEENLRVAQENAQSPDLTHLRTVKEGDTLPLMCHRIYGDSSLYLEIARVNKLKNFRQLEVNQQLFFPPIDKSKT